jgi:hypothetical protein
MLMWSERAGPSEEAADASGSGATVFLALTSDDQVVAAVQQQIDGMRAAGYHRSEILGSEVTVLNSTSGLYRGTFSRHRSDGGEIRWLTATYLVTDGARGRRISVLTVHSS